MSQNGCHAKIAKTLESSKNVVNFILNKQLQTLPLNKFKQST